MAQTQAPKTSECKISFIDYVRALGYINSPKNYGCTFQELKRILEDKAYICPEDAGNSIITAELDKRQQNYLPKVLDHAMEGACPSYGLYDFNLGPLKRLINEFVKYEKDKAIAQSAEDNFSEFSDSLKKAKNAYDTINNMKKSIAEIESVIGITPYDNYSINNSVIRRLDEVERAVKQAEPSASQPSRDVQDVSRMAKDIQDIKETIGGRMPKYDFQDSISDSICKLQNEVDALQDDLRGLRRERGLDYREYHGLGDESAKRDKELGERLSALERRMDALEKKSKKKPLDDRKEEDEPARAYGECSEEEPVRASERSEVRSETETERSEDDGESLWDNFGDFCSLFNSLLDEDGDEASTGADGSDAPAGEADVQRPIVKDATDAELMDIFMAHRKLTTSRKHKIVDMDLLDETLDGLLQRNNDIVMVLMTDASFRTLFIDVDIADFLNFAYEMGEQLDFSYVYAVYNKASGIWFTPDAHDHGAISLLQDIGAWLIDKPATEDAIKSIPGIDIFREVCVR